MIVSSLKGYLMIIWRGFGFLVFVFGLVAMWATDGLVNKSFADPQYYAQHGWPKLIACMVAGVPTWVFGRQLNARHRRKWAAKARADDVYLSGHSLFFVPMQYWAVALVGFGIWACWVSPQW